MYSATVVKTGAGFTLTVNLSGNDSESQSRAVALEYSGVGAVDQANAVTGSAAAASVSTTAATKYANELVVSTFGVDNPADNFSTITPVVGFHHPWRRISEFRRHGRSGRGQDGGHDRRSEQYLDRVARP